MSIVYFILEIAMCPFGLVQEEHHLLNPGALNSFITLLIMYYFTLKWGWRRTVWLIPHVSLNPPPPFFLLLSVCRGAVERPDILGKGSKWEKWLTSDERSDFNFRLEGVQNKIEHYGSSSTEKSTSTL